MGIAVSKFAVEIYPLENVLSRMQLPCKSECTCARRKLEISK
jgi:hypothetical protein